MGRKRLINRVLTGIWILLLLFLLIFFLSSQFGGLSNIFDRLKREPQKLVCSFNPKDMAGFVCDFSQPKDLELWEAHQCNIQITHLPGQSIKNWAKVTYYPAKAPGFLWTDESMGTMDWRAAEAIKFKTYNPNGWVVDLKVKVKDEGGGKWQHNYKLPPGQIKQLEIPLSALKDRVNLGKINYFNLFLWDPAGETVLYYDDFSFPRPKASSPVTQVSKLEFLGLEFPPQVEPGEIATGSFYFLPKEKLSGDYNLLVSLRPANDSREIQLLSIPPPFPPSRWKVGKMAKIGPMEINIPATLSLGTYDLTVILAQKLYQNEEEQLFFEPYSNPDLKGHSVAKVLVRQ